MPKTKRPRGRPSKPLPPRIDAPPEELAKAMLRLPQDHQWRYLKKEGESGLQSDREQG